MRGITSVASALLVLVLATAALGAPAGGACLPGLCDCGCIDGGPCDCNRSQQFCQCVGGNCFPQAQPMTFYRPAPAYYPTTGAYYTPSYNYQYQPAPAYNYAPAYYQPAYRPYAPAFRGPVFGGGRCGPFGCR